MTEEEKEEDKEKKGVKVEEQGWILGGEGVAKLPSEKNHHLYDGFPYELAIY